jgi:hypothetical protein
MLVFSVLFGGLSSIGSVLFNFDLEENFDLTTSASQYFFQFESSDVAHSKCSF